jgi:protein-tyrosine phosphatase
MTSAGGTAAVNMLFVCTGNLCRSAAADRLLTAWAGRGTRSVAVRSAGTLARPGRVIHPSTARALRAHSVSGDGFTSRRLSEGDLDWADLVLTMTSDHRDEVVAVSPRALQKCFTLLEAAALSRAVVEERQQLNGGRRGPALAAALREARLRFARASGPDFDVPDPIDGPDALHADVVDRIAAALGYITAVLEDRNWAEETVPMPRLPPVPRAS